MNTLSNLKGARVGRLVVLRRAPDRFRKVSWRCQCECGSMVSVTEKQLLSVGTKSCGCLRADASVSASIKTNTKHGLLSGHERRPEYEAWSNIIKRCKPTYPQRKNYYDKGITVCQEWEQSIEQFISHVGSKPEGKHSLRRINKRLGYRPGNVEWKASA